MNTQIDARWAPLLVIALASAACDSEEYEGDDVSESDSFRTAGVCDETLFDVVWIDNPPFAEAGGDPVIARGEVHYDASGAVNCDMNNWSVTFNPQPALSVADNVHELNGVWSPGMTIPFELTLKAKKDAIASATTPKNSYIVGCLPGDCDATPSSPPADLCVIPEDEVSLKVVDTDGDLKVDGSCVAGGNECVPMPSNAPANGFGQGLKEGLFPFFGLLQPKPASFDGRQVFERQIGTPVGDCGWTGLTSIEQDPWVVHASALGGVIDAYGVDSIGFMSTFISPLREFQRPTGCVSTVEQAMAMLCPDGEYYDYETHAVTIAVEFDCNGGSVANGYSVTRDGVCAHEVWDPDANDDGVADHILVDQAGLAPKDKDKDFDGVPDHAEGSDGDPVTPGDPDTDADLIPDFLDGDDDGDAVATNTEVNLTGGRADTDGDGLLNHVDADDDGDGLLSAAEDADGNGQPETDDSDVDGAPDAYESATADLDGDGTTDQNDTDDDGDGILLPGEDSNGNENPLDDDSDGDGVPNFRDP